MNGESELTLDAIAASSEKTSDPSENMEQRYADRVHVKHVFMTELRYLAAYGKSCDSAEHAAVENHSADVLAEQHGHETQEIIIRDMLEQTYYLWDVCNSEDNMSAENEADDNADGGNDEVINAESLLFSYHQISDQHAYGNTHDRADRV